jgi:hypothetical protein
MKMPGGDRTGPERRGPLTGRRLGFCAGTEPISRSFRGGFGRGRGYGRERGFGLPTSNNISGIQPVLSKDNTIICEIDELKDRIRYLEEELQRTLDKSLKS